jgi:hypothetical protein
MGAVGAVAAGVSAVGGLVSLSNQQKQARAQRKALDAQKKQQQLQADLQLVAIKNQRLIDEMQDALEDAARQQAFLQTDAALRMQEQLNALAVENAKFVANLDLIKSRFNEQQTQLKAEEKATREKQRADEELISALGQTNAAYANQIKALLNSLQQDTNQRQALLALLDAGAAKGGINEALLTLLDTASPENEFEVARAGELVGTKAAKLKAMRDSNVAMADAEKTLVQNTASLDRVLTDYKANQDLINATAAGDVAANAFRSQRLANQANYNIGVLANEVARQSRYLQSQLNEEVLKQGVALSADTLEAQKRAIRTPGFFDYLALGLNAYNTYQKLTP